MKAYPRFIYLWIATVLSGTGLQMCRVAIILEIYGAHGSPAAIAAFVLLETLPGALAGTHLGAYVDRMGQAPLMIASEICRAFLFAVVLFYSSSSVLFVVAALGSILTAAYQPARDSSVPLLVDPESIAEANGFDQVGLNLVTIVGPITSSLIFVHFGLKIVIACGIVLFLLSALIVRQINIHKAGRNDWRNAENNKQHGKSASGDTPPTLVIVFVLFFVGVAASALWLPYAPGLLATNLNADVVWIGYLLGLTGIGGVLGGVIAPRVMRRLNLLNVLLIGAAAEAACLVAFAHARSLLFATGVALLWGIAASFITTPFYTLIHRSIEHQRQGFVFGFVRRLDFCGIIFGTLVCLAAQDRFSLGLIPTIAGITYLCLTIIASTILIGDKEKNAFAVNHQDSNPQETR